MEKLVVIAYIGVIVIIAMLVIAGIVIGKFGLTGLFWICAVIGAIFVVWVIFGFIFNLFF